mgnify:FL=1
MGSFPAGISLVGLIPEGNRRDGILSFLQEKVGMGFCLYLEKVDMDFCLSLEGKVVMGFNPLL